MAGIRKPARYLVLIVLFLIFYTQEPLSNYGFPSRQSSRKLSIVRSNISWVPDTPFYPPISIAPLPTGKPRAFPQIQHTFPPHSRIEQARQEPRRQAVKATFEKCWQNYKKYAWMKDELTPIQGGARNTFGGFAATLIDSLDTLWIMDMKDEYYEAVEAAITIDWGNTTVGALNIFETTIRHLGGLLSAYDLSGDKALLEKAVELGDMLYAGFDTPNRMPGFWLDFRKVNTGTLLADDRQPSASPCSLSLEFTRLAQLTGDSKYYDAIARITDLLAKSQYTTQLPGMWPTFFDMRHLRFNQENAFTLGALADSLYEYLPKMSMLLGGLEPVYQKLFEGAVEVIKKTMLFRPMLPDQADILFSGNVYVSEGKAKLVAEGQHLGCFTGGMFAMGGRLLENQEYIDIGTKLTRGCIYAYNAFPSGVMPEIFNMVACDSQEVCEWNEQLWSSKLIQEDLPLGFTTVSDPRYILRPEALESVFYLYRITGLKEFQDAAWEMFESIQRITETQFGNAAVVDVTVANPVKENSMEVSAKSCKICSLC